MANWTLGNWVAVICILTVFAWIIRWFLGTAKIATELEHQNKLTMIQNALLYRLLLEKGINQADIDQFIEQFLKK